MKTLRIWLVLLLALLLPIRGAVAAGMLCEAGGPLHHGAESHGSAHGAGHAHDAAGHHGHAGHDHGAHHHAAGAEGAGATDDSASASVPAGADACGVCASCCCASAIVGNLLRVAAPDAFNPVPLSTAGAAAPSFITDGLERPPRSI